jgi:phage shock protein A
MSCEMIDRMIRNLTHQLQDMTNTLESIIADLEDLKHEVDCELSIKQEAFDFYDRTGGID